MIVESGVGVRRINGRFAPSSVAARRYGCARKKTFGILPDRGWSAARVTARSVCGALPPKFCYISGMERDAAIATLRANETELRRLGVQHLYLFGSTARGEARNDSDVDLFFDYEKGRLSLFDLMEVKEQAARILGCPADIMTRDSLHRLIRARVEASALQVF